jgi:alkanesulfonate monooxygenase SsuD/methylene tetrahydromethanopterin reductase-like flavin-dependent oxidoreductase (luciferase family)
MSDDSAPERAPHPWVTSGHGTIRFGVAQLASLDNWSAYLDMVQLAEELGFDSYWMYDHPMLGADCWTVLSAVAATTSRLRLGSLTSCIYYRPPALLARIAADVDRVSAGRLVLGLGIGDAPDEFAQQGIPFRPVRERQQALEDAIRVVLGLWREQPFTYQGPHFQVQGGTGAPVPVQRPHVPLLIAGGGERVTLRQVAQFADVSNFGAHAWAGSAFTPDDVRRKYGALCRHCEALGRPYESILRTYLDFPIILAETPDAVQAKVAAMPQEAQTFYQSSLLATTPGTAVIHYRALAASGVQYFIAATWEHDAETLRLLAQRVMPEVIGG